MIDEIDIIARASGGDERAYLILLNCYKPRIFSYVLRMVRNYHDAEEITLDTFIKCFKSLKSFDCTKNFSTWLYTIAHNRTIDYFRKRRRHEKYLDDRAIEDIEIADKKTMASINNFNQQVKLNKIEQALLQLPPIDRAIVLLFHKEEKTYQEIAEILKIPESTIKTRLHRARLRLRKLCK